MESALAAARARRELVKGLGNVWDAACTDRLRAADRALIDALTACDVLRPGVAGNPYLQTDSEVAAGALLLTLVEQWRANPDAGSPAQTGPVLSVALRLTELFIRLAELELPR